MPGRNLAFYLALILLPLSLHATDLDHSVSGSDVEDVLGQSTAPGNSPFIVEGEPGENVDASKAKGNDYIFNHGVKEVTDKVTPKKKFEDFGYTTPGTFENQPNYLETDKVQMAKELRKSSGGGMNITFIKNDYDYQSKNDIINRTIGEGYKSVKGGAIYFRNDDYLFKTDFLNMHWSLGAGVGYNSGKGIFVDGTRSDTTFNLWEVPVDLGLGLEIPLGSWFKIAGTGGGSVLGLMQNRSDYQRGEDGKRKFQCSPGYFANAQFKINLSGFSSDTAYDVFTSGDITNLYLNLEIRHQNYENFQDEIKVSGTSYGIGFTFEYL